MTPLNPREQFPDVPTPDHSIESVRDMPPFSGVYVSYVNGFAVYVGESQDVTTRVARTREELADSESMGVVECPPEYRQLIEAHFISLLNPPRNGNSSHRLDKGENEVAEIMKWRPTQSGQLSKDQNEDSERRFREGYQAALENVAKHSSDNITTLQKEIHKWVVGPQNDNDGNLILPPEYFADGRKAPSSNGLELELFGVEAVKDWNPTFEVGDYPMWLKNKVLATINEFDERQKKDFKTHFRRYDHEQRDWVYPKTVTYSRAFWHYMEAYEESLEEYMESEHGGTAILDGEEVLIVFPCVHGNKAIVEAKTWSGLIADKFNTTVAFSKKSAWGPDKGILVFRCKDKDIPQLWIDD